MAWEEKDSGLVEWLREGVGVVAEEGEVGRQRVGEMVGRGSREKGASVRWVEYAR